MLIVIFLLYTESFKTLSSIITNLAIKGGQSANHCSLVGALMGCINGKSIAFILYGTSK